MTLVNYSASYAQNDTIDSLETYHNIDTEISLRPWNTKGSGNVTGHETISLIKTKSGVGTVVILKWGDALEKFDVEVYKNEPPSEFSPEKIDTWKITNSKTEKTLSDQHNHFYTIQYAVPGPKGGIVSQTFRLP